MHAPWARPNDALPNLKNVITRSTHRHLAIGAGNNENTTKLSKGIKRRSEYDRISILGHADRNVAFLYSASVTREPTAFGKSSVSASMNSIHCD